MKLKIYLDTNTIIDFFINRAKAIKKGVELVVPEKINFFIENLDKLEFLTSFLVKAEVVREMLAGRDIEKEEVERAWKEFLNLIECDYVPGFYFDEKLVEICGSLKLKLRTLMNFQHLFIAISKDVYFVTGDKDIIEKVRQLKIYDKVLSYIELRKLISSSFLGF